MLPICLLLGYLIGELISRYYHSKSKAHKYLFAILVPLCVGILIDCILTYSQHPDEISFSYVLGMYMPFTILPAIVTMITLFVRLKVNPEEDIITADDMGIENNSTKDESENQEPEAINESVNQLPKDSIAEKSVEGPQEQQEACNTDSKKEDVSKQKDIRKESDSIHQLNNTVITIDDDVQHIVKITSNVECTVYLDCEKIGSVADGKMIKLAIKDGPYLLRCESIFDEVIEYSFELSKDELFNFKFKNDGKPKKRWFSNK